MPVPAVLLAAMPHAVQGGAANLIEMQPHIQLMAEMRLQIVSVTALQMSHMST